MVSNEETYNTIKEIHIRYFLGVAMAVFTLVSILTFFETFGALSEYPFGVNHVYHRLDPMYSKENFILFYRISAPVLLILNVLVFWRRERWIWMGSVLLFSLICFYPRIV